MITLLAKLFIREDLPEAEMRTAYGKICGTAGIILNVFLFGFKLFAGLVSGSISITADAMNNLSDSGSAIVTLVGFKMAAEEPDPDRGCKRRGFDPWVRNIPGRGNGNNPLQYFCLKNPTEEPGRLPFKGSLRVGYD